MSLLSIVEWLTCRIASEKRIDNWLMMSRTSLMDNAMPPLHWLLTFNAVMEEGSFAVAARRLNVTPSAISHQMRALERRLGRSMFLRDKRIVTPTEEAITYSASVAESFVRLATATNRLMSTDASRRLPIHCSPSFATLWLTPGLATSWRITLPSTSRCSPATNPRGLDRMASSSTSSTPAPFPRLRPSPAGSPARSRRRSPWHGMSPEA